jgi:hypothetical protein
MIRAMVNLSILVPAAEATLARILRRFPMTKKAEPPRAEKCLIARPDPDFRFK